MTEPLNRRTFLTAAAGAAALAVGTRAYAQTTDKIKVGVIGCGGRGGGAVRNVLDADKGVEIAALCDLFPEKAKGVLGGIKNKYKERVTATDETCYSGFEGFKQLLALDHINYVILATPPGFRPMQLEAAVNAGKNIFTEKPVAVDVAGARKCFSLVKTANEKNLKIAAGTQRRHQSGYIETIKQMSDGLIGEILSARVYWNGTTPWYHQRPKDMADARYQLYNWYHYVWTCGDHICEQHVHNLDVANWALGAVPVRATGMGGRSNRPVGDAANVGNIFDHFAIEYEYPNGVIVQSQCRQIDGTQGNVSEDFVGTKGKVHLSPGTYIANGKDLGEGKSEVDPYVQEHIDLIKAIREDKKLNELENVTNSTFTAILGRMSTYSGKSLKWDEVLNGTKWFEDTFPKNLTALDQALPADAVPVVGRWMPKKA